MYRVRFYFFIIFLSVVFILFSCKQSDLYTSPPEYDLQSPSSLSLPSVMKNISGISFFKGNASMLYAIDENVGKIYCYYISSYSIVQSSFAMTGPFMDLSIMDSSIYVLKNNGTIYSFPVKSMGKPILDTCKTYDDFFPKGTYEAMYYADSSRKLVIINKSVSKEQHNTKCYVFSVDSSGIPHKSDSFVISWNTIAKKLHKNEISGFHPTAIAQNPMNSQWYIISDNEKILFILDKNWHPRRAYALNPKIFTQPQGLTFDKAGNLYIANDGTETSSPNIKIFSYKKSSVHALQSDDMD